MQQAYIVAAYRSAVGRSKKGQLRFVRSDDMAAQVIKHLLKNTAEFDHHLIDDVIVGCANPEGEQGLQIGRQIALQSIGKAVPGFTINRYCASGLESIALASAKINAGMGSCFLAGGAESMSMIPMTGYKLAPSYKVGLENPDYIISMGLTAEAVANKYDISRDAQDEFAFNSHQKAAHAIDHGYFEGQIAPLEVERVYLEDGQRQEEKYTFKVDEGVRRDTSIEALGRLRAVFAQKGSVTAGNSSQTSDGAAFALVVSEAFMKENNLTPIGRVVSSAVAGVDPVYMGIGPCAAIPKALKQAGLTLDQIDTIELNEAFAAQSLAVIKEAGLDPSKVNVNGGAIALGHPLGCTGAKLTTQVLNELKRQDKTYGMVTACVGGGQGIAAVIERL